jgi:hypothetical protein
MMRKFAQFFLVACISLIPAVAQRGGGGRGGGGFHGGMGGFHGGGGFRGGMGGFHGGGGFRGGGGFHGGMGGFHGGGFNGGFAGRGFHGGFRGFHGGFRPGYRFYGYPGYWSNYGGWGYPYYGYPYYYSAPAYSYPYVYSYPYSTDNTYTSAQSSCPQVNGMPLYQIKLTYQSDVWLAQKYWYTPGTLNFITLQGEEKKTPIDSIDAGLTDRLNRACGLSFQFTN